jgi:6-phosphogluconolactonase (cycloisomerase 2 family)
LTRAADIRLASSFGRENGMNFVRKIFSCSVVAATLLMLAGCGQKSNCNGISFGGTGSGSGAGGGVSTGGSVCGSSGNNSGGGGGASDLLYYLGGGTVIDVASLTSTTFANVSGYTPIAFANGTQLGQDFAIVNEKFLYVPIIAPTGGGAVLAYSIARGTAGLTPLASSPFPTSTPHADTAVSDPTGRFLFVSDSASASIAVFKIDPTTGNLTASGTPVSAGGAGKMVIDGTGSYLYFPYATVIYGFSIDQTSGALTPLFGSPFNLPMIALQADSTGQFLLGVTGNQGDNNVYVIPIGTGTGMLGLATFFPTVQSPSSLALSSTGKFLFTFAVDAVGRPLPIEGFTFDVTTGNVAEMTNSPFTSLAASVTGQFDQNGTVLLGVTVTNFNAYLINQSTGAPSSPTPSLGVAHDQRYAITN